MVCLALLSWTGICTCDAADDDDGFLSAVMEFTGCTDAGEVDGDEVGRLSEYYEHPLMLNYASRSRLLSSGLLSAYQVAVLTDYRERTGDILSFEELAVLDGFGRDFVSGLKYFVSLESHSLPGIPSSRPAAVRNTATFRSGVRTGEDRYEPEGTYSMKYSVRAGERFEAGISMRSAYQESHFPPEKISFHAALYGRRRPWKILAGDFRLRFGQGLALWPGFSMSGVSTPDAFARKPSGISPYNSYSGEGAFRGIAADFSLKHFTVSAFVSGLGLRDLAEGGKEISPDLLYGLNAGWYGMSGQMSITCFAVFSDSQDFRRYPFLVQGDRTFFRGGLRYGVRQHRCPGRCRIARIGRGPCSHDAQVLPARLFRGIFRGCTERKPVQQRIRCIHGAVTFLRQMDGHCGKDRFRIIRKTVFRLVFSGCLLFSRAEIRYGHVVIPGKGHGFGRYQDFSVFQSGTEVFRKIQIIRRTGPCRCPY